MPLYSRIQHLCRRSSHRVRRRRRRQIHSPRYYAPRAIQTGGHRDSQSRREIDVHLYNLFVINFNSCVIILSVISDSLQLAMQLFFDFLRLYNVVNIVVSLSSRQAVLML